ncbi:MAG TPA: hypothetical protein VII56_01350 [Rhizomicrobium sp.]
MDQIEVHNVSILESLANAISKLTPLIDRALQQADEDATPRLRRIEHAREEAREELRRAERALQEADEDDRENAQEAVDEARERLAKIDRAVEQVQRALSRYKHAAREFGAMRNGIVASASHFLRVRLEAVRDYLRLQLSATALGGSSTPRHEPTASSVDPSTLVKTVLERKKGLIRKAPLPRGSPSWSNLQHETMGDIERKARENVVGYRTVKKLLTDRRFEK